MKKKYLFALLGMLPLFGMIVSGCSCAQQEPEFEPVDPYVPPEGEPEDPETADNILTAIHMQRTKDFFMQKDEVLDFHVTFDNAGGEDQKGIKWSSTNPNIVKITQNERYPEKSYYVNLTALREGSCTITARSTFSTSLTCSVSITVIDNSEYTSFWQKNPDAYEQKLFNNEYGLTSKTGSIKLGNLTWNFEFEKTPIAVGGGQLFKFGSKDAPFGSVHFDTVNTEKIRKISVLCSSSAEHIDDGSPYGKSGSVGTSKITIKVGDTVYVDNINTPKNSNDSSLELDTVTGGVYDTTPLEGNISIDFSPTYYTDPNINSGAIYLKAIIIEYYRGPLDHIAVESVNDFNNQFYVGTKYNAKGIDVNAYFTEKPSVKVNVNHLASYQMDNIDESGNFIDSNAAQPINVSFEYAGVTKSTSYTVNVAPRISNIVIDGSLEEENSKYLVRDEISYKGIHIKIYATGVEDPVQTFDLDSIVDEKLLASFDVSNVHRYAIKTLQDGFTIYFEHLLSGISKSYTFEANEMIVKAVSKIDVEYKEGSPRLSLIEGASMTATNGYENFNVKVTYDNDETTDFTFTELNNHKYYDVDESKEKVRFNFKAESPCVVDKSFATTGLPIVIKDMIGGVRGEFTYAPENFDLKYVTAIELLGTPAETTYHECDDLDFTGVTAKLTYSDETNETITFAELEALTTRFPTTTEGSSEAKPLFNIYAPIQATAALTEGFDLRVASSRDPNISSTLRIENITSVEPIKAKRYLRIDSASEFVSGDKYLIVNVDSTMGMRVWNGDLSGVGATSSSTPPVSKADNYFNYTYSEAISDELIIKSGQIDRATFVMTSYSGDPIKYSIKHTGTNKYYKFDDGKFTTSLNTKTQVYMSFAEDEDPNVTTEHIGLRAIYESTNYGITTKSVAYLRFNVSTNKFGTYELGNTTTRNNTREIAIYRLAGSVE